MMNPTVRRATKRTIGALCLSILTLVVMPVLAGRAHNPILNFSLILATLMLLYRIWNASVSDAQIAVFHLLVNAVNLVKKLRQEFLTFDPNMAPNETRRQNRKLIRAAILFVMAQKVLIPHHSLSWLHSLLAYKFLLDVMTYTQRVMRRRLRERRRRVDEGARTQRTASDDIGGEAPGEGNAAGDAAQRVTPSGSTPRYTLLPDVHLLAIQIFKILFCAGVLHHQLLYTRVTYIITTLTYFLLSHHVLHRPVTLTLESLQLDYFEGLESYYVTGLLGTLEIFYSLIFMMLCLLDASQLLMLVALYTNVYTCARELVHHSVNSAFAEWTILAHFDKATQRELRELNDVCAICLSDMWSARKTPCQHFFHGRCLRKCLKERAACPMCFKNFNFY